MFDLYAQMFRMVTIKNRPTQVDAFRMITVRMVTVRMVTVRMVTVRIRKRPCLRVSVTASNSIVYGCIACYLSGRFAESVSACINAFEVLASLVSMTFWR